MKLAREKEFGLLDEVNRKRDEAKKLKGAAGAAERAIATQNDRLKNNF